MEKTVLTFLDDSSEDEEVDVNIVINLPTMKSSDILELTLDQSIGVDQMLNALNEYHKRRGPATLEPLNKVMMMYTMGKTLSLERYIQRIVKESTLAMNLRLDVALKYCSFNKTLDDDDKRERGYSALLHVCNEQEFQSISTTVKLNAIIVLMHYESYKDQAMSHFSILLNSTKLDCDYRYKMLLTLENRVTPYSLMLWYMSQGCTMFLMQDRNMTMYRILAGQYLMQKCKDRIPGFAEDFLMDFAQDPDLDYNLRADAADVILGLGNNEMKEQAREVIMLLGLEGGDGKTVYGNAQNVHTHSVEESVLEVIQTLYSMEYPIELTFDQVKSKAEEVVEHHKDELELTEEDLKKIKVALNRVTMDRALYSKHKCGLKNIMVRVWTWMQHSEYLEEMEKRLLQELIEMSGTCSSGFASRLCNVVCGFGEMNLRISWEEQIVGNLNGRLNARIRDMEKDLSYDDVLQIIVTHLEEEDELKVDPKVNEGYKVKLNRYERELCDANPEMKQKNEWEKENGVEENDREVRKMIVNKFRDEAIETYRGNVVMEMSVKASSWAQRTNFLRFFRKSVMPIREEMWQEFKEHLHETDFDLYYRRAILVYEGENY